MKEEPIPSSESDSDADDKPKQEETLSRISLKDGSSEDSVARKCLEDQISELELVESMYSPDELHFVSENFDGVQSLTAQIEKDFIDFKSHSLVEFLLKIVRMEAREFLMWQWAAKI